MIRRDWLKSLAGILGVGLAGGAPELLAGTAPALEKLPTEGGSSFLFGTQPFEITADMHKQPREAVMANIRRKLERYHRQTCGLVQSQAAEDYVQHWVDSDMRKLFGTPVYTIRDNSDVQKLFGYPVCVIHDSIIMDCGPEGAPGLRTYPLPPTIFLDVEGTGPSQKTIERIFAEQVAGQPQPGILTAPFEPVKPKPIPQYTPCNVALKHEPVKGEAGRFFEIITQTEAELLNDRRKALHDGRGWLTQQAPGPLLNVDGLDDEECVDLGISAVKQRMRQLIDEWDGTPDDELGERLREFADPYV